LSVRELPVRFLPFPLPEPRTGCDGDWLTLLRLFFTWMKSTGIALQRQPRMRLAVDVLSELISLLLQLLQGADLNLPDGFR